MKLPVSGLEVGFRLPDGEDDLAVLEDHGSAVDRALTILERLGEPAAGSVVWADLTVTDVEYALLAARLRIFGDAVACVFPCPVAGCGERLELDFSVTGLMSDVRAESSLELGLIETRPGWFAWEHDGSLFRLPTVADQAAVAGRTDAAELLAQRCIEPSLLNKQKRMRMKRAQMEKAMAKMAPEVSRMISGGCPACGKALSMPLHVPGLVVEEFRRSAAGLHDEVHLLALTYHWDERTILEMPRVRRQAYAERVRSRYREAS